MPVRAMSQPALETPPAVFAPASRLTAIGVSPILQIDAQAAQMARAGRSVISLGAGEPDFDTPNHIKLAAWQAICDGQTKYTALTGTPALKAAICAKFATENGLSYRPSQIIVGTGAKQIIHTAMMATLEPGDEVILPTPYWVSYADMVRLCGGVPVPVPCPAAQGFRLQPEALRRAITPRSRWIIFNSPSNPSGMVYTAADYSAVIAPILDHPRLMILADDIYEHIIFDALPFYTPACLGPLAQQRCLTVNGVSKAYAMTGWRIGYGAGPDDLIAAMAVVQSQTTSCASAISQSAAIAALSGLQTEREAMRQKFEQRRDLTVSSLNAIAGLRCLVPQGAFYAFPDCRTLLERSGLDDMAFAQALLAQTGVAVVPGAVFGAPGHIRISFATADTLLADALDRLAGFCASL